MKDLIWLFWIADVMNLSFMEQFDTIYPLNEEFWFIALIILAIFGSRD